LLKKGVGNKMKKGEVCMNARILLDDLDSHPGSEYQFAIGCVDVFKAFFKYHGAECVTHPVFRQLYTQYREVIESYRGRIDFSKIERSLITILDHNDVSLDSLASGEEPKKKEGHKKAKTDYISPQDVDIKEYARRIDVDKIRKESRIRRNGAGKQKSPGQSYKEEEREAREKIENPHFREEIRDSNEMYVYESLARVKGLHTLLAEIYKGSIVDRFGEKQLGPNFVEAWLDFRKEVIFLNKHQEQALEFGENIAKYNGSPQQLFEIVQDFRLGSLPRLDLSLSGIEDFSSNETN
jgi:hypothetical protein